jgi:adenosylhomocysteine nucleosidase
MTDKNESDSHPIDVGIIMATELEALPLIEKHNFYPICCTPFPAYQCGRYILVISGMGMSAAASATTWLIMQHDPICIVNAGAAGSTTGEMKLGAVCQIQCVCGGDQSSFAPMRDLVYEIPTTEDLPAARLSTHDNPVVTEEERKAVSRVADLVDMEGAAVAQVCQRFGKPVRLIKFVSDSDASHSIPQNITALRGGFCETLLTYIGSLCINELSA